MMLISAATTLFHTTQAWPVVVPFAFGLLYAGLGLFDRFPRVRKWLGMGAIVAAVQLLVALVVSRHWFLVVVVPAGAIVLLVYALVLDRRLPTIQVHRQESIKGVIWSVEPPVKPLPGLRWLGRGSQKRWEIDLGRRGLRVGWAALQAYADAQTNRNIEEYDWNEYQGQLQMIKDRVGAAWLETLTDMKEHGLFENVSFTPRDISVNYTGLDSQALTMQAIGRQLLRKHGIDPDSEEEQSRMRGLAL